MTKKKSTKAIEVCVKLMRPNARLPKRSSELAVGYDLYYIESGPMYIHPGSCGWIRTGVAIEMPADMEAQLRLRSSFSRMGLLLTNAPGTIDPDYRGEILGQVWNIGRENIVIHTDERPLQLVFNRIIRPTLSLVDELSNTKRGEGGYGSTGR